MNAARKRGRGGESFFGHTVVVGMGMEQAVSERRGPAPTSSAKRARSMLPPETTATTLPRPARPLRAAAMAHPAAPSATTCTRSAAWRIAAVTSSSDITSDPSTRRAAAATCSAAPTCRRRRRRTTRSSRRSSWARRGPATWPAARPSRARRRRRRTPGFSARITEPTPASRPPPPSGVDHRIDLGQILEDLEAGGGVAGDEVVVVEGVHEVPAHAIRAVRFDGAPRFVVGDADDLGAERLDRLELRHRAPCPSPSPSTTPRPGVRRRPRPERRCPR